MAYSTVEEVAALERELPGTIITIVMNEGDRLSHSIGEGSYSHVLAEIFTAGDSEADLERTYDRCVDGLHFDIESAPENSL